MSLFRTGFLLAVLLLPPGPLFALTGPGITADENFRFSSGFPSSPVPNTHPDYVALGFDLSGVAWTDAIFTGTDGRKNLGMLSPKHFLMARHFAGLSGSPMYFLGGDGNVHAYSGASVTVNTSFGIQLGSNNNPDIALWRMSQRLDPAHQITTYAVYDQNITTSTDILHYGGGPNSSASPRVAFEQPSNIYHDGSGPFAGNSYFFTPRVDVQLQEGDSGGPAFRTWTDPTGQQQLTVVGLNSAIGTVNGNPINIISMLSTTNGVLDQLNTAMAAQGYAVRMVRDADQTWVGGGGPNGNRFDLNQNWSGNAPSSTTYAALAADSTSIYNLNLNGTRNAKALIFNPSTSKNAFTIGGGTLNLGRGGIINYDAGVRQVLSANLTLADHQYWDMRSGGVLVTGNLDTNGFLVIIEGSGTGANANRITGNISGTGALAKDGPGLLLLEGGLSYTGNTWIHGGTLRLENGALLPSSTGLFIADQNDARFELNGGAQTVAFLASDGGFGTSTVDLGSTGSLTITGSAETAFMGSITGGTAGVDTLTKSGSNHLTLGGPSDYEGITRINQGIVFVENAQALGASGTDNRVIAHGLNSNAQSGRIRVNGDFTLDQDIVLSFFDTTNNARTYTNALQNNSGSPTIAGTITLDRAGSGNHTINWQIHNATPGSTLTLNDITGTLTGSAPGGSNRNRLNLIAGPDASIILNGQISDGTIGNTGIDVMALGGGFFEINATSTYTGRTTLQNGTILASIDAPAGQPGAFGNSNQTFLLGLIGSTIVGDELHLLTANAITIGHNIRVGAGDSTAALTLGGTTAHTSTFSGQLDLHRTPTFVAAPGGTVQFTNTIFQTTAGSGVVIDAAGGVIRLSGNNTFTGGVDIQQGTLQIGHASALGTGDTQIGTGTVLEIDAGIVVGNNLLAATGGIVRQHYNAASPFADLQVTAQTALGTTASLLGGQASVGGLTANLSFSEGLSFGASDILDLTGLNGEVFVLQLTYDPLLIQPGAPGVMLGWNDNGLWRNAVLGNQTGNAFFVGDTAYDGILQTGRWGFDSANNTAWAVLDHNSQFMVLSIPEPGTAALLLLAAAAGWRLRRKA